MSEFREIVEDYLNGNITDFHSAMDDITCSTTRGELYDYIVEYYGIETAYELTKHYFIFNH